MPIPQDLPLFSGDDGHPPFHPNCRCTVSATFRGDFDAVLRGMSETLERIDRALQRRKAAHGIDWRDVEFVVWDALRKPPEGI